MVYKVKECPECEAINEQYAYMCSNKDCKCSLMNVAEEDKPVTSSGSLTSMEDSLNINEKPYFPTFETVNSIRAYLKHDGPAVLCF